MSRSLAEKLVQIMGVVGSLPADSSGHDIAVAVRSRWGASSPGTLLRMLSQVRAILKVAERDGLIAKAPHLTMPAVYDVADCPITPTEAKLLLSHLKIAAPRWWPLAMVLTHTGGRLGEVLALRKSDLTEAGVRLRKPAARRSKAVDRTIPLTGALRQAVERGELHAPTLRDSPYVFVPSGGVKPGTAKSVSAQLGRVIKEACFALGLPSVRVHDLRHVFAAAVAERGGDLSDIASLLGHTNLKTTMRYRGLVRRRAQAILDGVL